MLSGTLLLKVTNVLESVERVRWMFTSAVSVSFGYWATPETLTAYVLKIKLPSLVQTPLLAEQSVVVLGVGDSGQLDV